MYVIDGGGVRPILCPRFFKNLILQDFTENPVGISGSQELSICATKFEENEKLITSSVLINIFFLSNDFLFLGLGLFSHRAQGVLLHTGGRTDVLGASWACLCPPSSLAVPNVNTRKHCPPALLGFSRMDLEKVVSKSGWHCAWSFRGWHEGVS